MPTHFTVVVLLTVSVAGPLEEVMTLFAPAELPLATKRPSTVWLTPPRSNVPPVAAPAVPKTRSVAEEREPPVVSWSVPAAMTVGALAYLLLFIPVVIFGRWVETRFAWKK